MAPNSNAGNFDWLGDRCRLPNAVVDHDYCWLVGAAIRLVSNLSGVISDSVPYQGVLRWPYTAGIGSPVLDQHLRIWNPHFHGSPVLLP